MYESVATYHTIPYYCNTPPYSNKSKITNGTLPLHRYNMMQPQLTRTLVSIKRQRYRINQPTVGQGKVAWHAVPTTELHFKYCTCTYCTISYLLASLYLPRHAHAEFPLHHTPQANQPTYSIQLHPIHQVMLLRPSFLSQRSSVRGGALRTYSTALPSNSGY